MLCARSSFYPGKWMELAGRLICSSLLLSDGFRSPLSELALSDTRLRRSGNLDCLSTEGVSQVWFSIEVDVLYRADEAILLMSVRVESRPGGRAHRPNSIIPEQNHTWVCEVAVTRCRIVCAACSCAGYSSGCHHVDERPVNRGSYAPTLQNNGTTLAMTRIV